MSRVVLAMSVSMDGFACGPDVTAEHPMGKGGERLHEWLFNGDSDGDAQQVRERNATTGSVVIGRRTFDVGVDLWQDTPFPVPCFVVTHEQRDPLTMPSDTFTFVTDGLDDTLRLARQAAGERNVLIMGGPTVGQQFVRAVALPVGVRAGRASPPGDGDLEGFKPAGQFLADPADAQQQDLAVGQ